MKKGINALEIVFGVFILIIVTLVVVKMLFRPNTQIIDNKLSDIQNQQSYMESYRNCGDLCSEYQMSNCDISKAAKFCKEKFSVDLDGNNEPGEASSGVMQHGGLVDAIPYCEDGYYCFHAYKTCSCGNLVLDEDTCDALLCEYYVSDRGLTEEEAKETIRREIGTGTCKISTDKVPDYDHLDKDTIMGSGKNWFDQFGMGDCQLGGAAIGGSNDFSVYVTSCDVTVSSDGKLGSYDCDIQDLQGTCPEIMTVSIVDGKDNILIAMKGDIDKGKIEFSENKLTGDAAFDLNAGADPVDVTSGCATFLLTCGQDAYEALTCDFV